MLGKLGGFGHVDDGTERRPPCHHRQRPMGPAQSNESTLAGVITVHDRAVILTGDGRTAFGAAPVIDWWGSRDPASRAARHTRGAEPTCTD
jgi:hypothetical protein